MMERILDDITSLIILIIKRDYYNEMMIWKISFLRNFEEDSKSE